MTEIHNNQKLISQQVAKLDSNILNLNRQTKKWDLVTTATRNKVKVINFLVFDLIVLFFFLKFVFINFCRSMVMYRTGLR